MKSTTFTFRTQSPRIGAGFDHAEKSRTLLQTLRLWRQRANGRRRLGELTRCELEDIGIDRVDADIEARKPFWKA